MLAGHGSMWTGSTVLRELRPSPNDDRSQMFAMTLLLLVMLAQLNPSSESYQWWAPSVASAQDIDEAIHGEGPRDGRLLPRCAAPLLVTIVTKPLAVTPSPLAVLGRCAIPPPLASLDATTAAMSVAKDAPGEGAAEEEAERQI
jgi:hypothetical protein